MHLDRPICVDVDGLEVVGVYGVDEDGLLHVAVGRHTCSAPLGGSNPEVLAHVLMSSLVDEVVAHAHRGEPVAID
jgi:hypothetical protein